MQFGGSFAGDKAMSLYLDKCSTEFTTNAIKTHEGIGELSTRSSLLATKLDNAFNDFQLLSNTQFLENRIEEEPLELIEAQRKKELREVEASKILTKEERKTF